MSVHNLVLRQRHFMRNFATTALDALDDNGKLQKKLNAANRRIAELTDLITRLELNENDKSVTTDSITFSRLLTEQIKINAEDSELLEAFEKSLPIEEKKHAATG